MHACCLIREQPLYRRDAFEAGLKAAGYDVDRRELPRPGNVLVIWNRYHRYEHVAKTYERSGGSVIIAENGYLGRDWKGEHWYAIARSFHNGGGWWPEEPENLPDSQQRWNKIGVDLSPWRKGGGEIVILATRGIGPQGIREPDGWSERIRQRLANGPRPVRVRQHPGEGKCIPLDEDLANAWAVVTWGSGAALKALVMGIPVFYGFPKWIGAQAGQLINDGTDFEQRPTPNRIPMFRRLSWAMWNTQEIQTGEPFKCLLQ